MPSLAVVDAGPLIASLDRRDVNYARSVEVLRRADIRLVVPALVIAEVAYFVERRLGSIREAAFLRSLRGVEIEAPAVDDWPLIADLVEKYADFPRGTVDASIAVLADRLGTDLIVTLDRRHFEALRSPQGRAFRILPEPRRVNEESAAYERTATS